MGISKRRQRCSSWSRRPASRSAWLLIAALW